LYKANNIKLIFRKLSVLVFVILLLLTFSSCGKKIISPSNPNNVFVCTGNFAKRYHTNRNCDGLKNCKGTIEEISKDKAINDGKTICSMCK